MPVPAKTVITIPALCRDIKKTIASAEKFAAQAVKMLTDAHEKLESAEALKTTADREFESAGEKLIQLHKQCAEEKTSFERALKTHKVGVNKTRAYELIRVAGGIPGKIMKRSVQETRSKTAAREKARYHRASGSSLTHAPEDDTLHDRSGTIVPWPGAFKRPTPTPGTIHTGRITGKDAEEITGRCMNLIREGMRLTTVMPDFTQCTNRLTLAQTARRVAKAWEEVADDLERIERETATTTTSARR